MTHRYTLAQLPALVRELLAAYGERPRFALSGQLGSGKTTLIAECCRQLGVTDTVSSPSYAIVQEYAGRHDTTVYHLDCYRLGDVAEAIDAGIEDLLERATGPVFVEWPEVIEPLLPGGVVFLHLTHDSSGGGGRQLTITPDTSGSDIHEQ